MENEQPLRILMLEDSQDDAMLIQRALRKDNLSFIATCVDTEPEFRSAIDTFRPDVVLSDHGLPGFNSREALKICQKQRTLTPFILVSGTISDDYAVTCLREGADDYILKSNMTRLPAAIRSAVKKRKLEKLKRDTRLTLRKKNEELQKINQELDNFVYSVSHNLRGPLASVMGLLNVAKLETTFEGLLPLLAMMDGSVLRLDETIREILDYSRNARTEIQLGEIDWKQVIQTSLEKVDYLDPEHSLRPQIELVTHIPFFSDGDRIALILTNLLSNAMLYKSDNRAPEIVVRVITSQTECKIQVKDNGIGIAPEILPNVFNMFFKGVARNHGAGLGLYISREIVNKLSGKIEIRSVNHMATVVTVYLPNVKDCALDSDSLDG